VLLQEDDDGVEVDRAVTIAGNLLRTAPDVVSQAIRDLLPCLMLQMPLQVLSIAQARSI
jgi:hypothetical protein